MNTMIVEIISSNSNLNNSKEYSQLIPINLKSRSNAASEDFHK